MRFTAIELYCALGSGRPAEFWKKKSSTYLGTDGSVNVDGARRIVAPYHVHVVVCM